MIPRADALLAEHDVGLDGQMRRQRQLLIDHRDAPRACASRGLRGA